MLFVLKRLRQTIKYSAPYSGTGKAELSLCTSTPCRVIKEPTVYPEVTIGVTGFLEQYIGGSREELRTNNFSVKFKSDLVMFQVVDCKPKYIQGNCCQEGPHGKKGGKRKPPFLVDFAVSGPTI